MISNLSKLLTVHFPPLLTVVSAFLILVTFLSPIPIQTDGISLVSISTTSRVQRRSTFDTVSRRLPRAGAVSIVGRTTAQTGAGFAMAFGFLGSCTKKSSGANMSCTVSSVSPVYDLSSLPAQLQASFVTSPPQTSPQWTVITIICIFAFAILTVTPLFVTKLANNPALCRTTAWIGIIGWVTGLVTVIVLHVTFANAAAAFNMMAVNQKSQLVADLGNGFTIMWIAFALVVPSLICTLYSCKMHEEPKSG